MAAKAIGGAISIAAGIPSALGVDISTTWVEMKIVINNTSNWKIKVHHYEGGDWTDKVSDGSEIRPDDGTRVYNEWTETEHAEPGNGWLYIGTVKTRYMSNVSGSTMYNTVHFEVPGYPTASCMALWTHFKWWNGQGIFQAKLGFTNRFNDLNADDCPLRDQNLVNSNVSLNTSPAGGGPFSKAINITFTGNDFGKFDW